MFFLLVHALTLFLFQNILPHKSIKSLQIQQFLYFNFLAKLMKYLVAKLVAASFFVFEAVSQSTLDPKNPAWGWSDFQQLKCGDGYTQVSNYCVKCDATKGKFLDPVSKQCKSCPQGTKYSTTSKSCECECNPPRSINPTTKVCECTGGRVFQNNECKCPSDKPLWNGKRCVACPAGTTFEPKDKQCYHCPEGFVVDPSTHKCQPGL